VNQASFVPQHPPALPPVPVAFFGNRGDFFRLAARGAALELVTVGFYRFWLVTDIRRHLWSHTVVDGDAAFEVLTPFAVDGGPVVLVDRGYVRPVQGSGVPTIAPAPQGSVTITARLRDSEPVVQGKDPFRQDGVQQVYSISTTQVSTVVGMPLAGSYLQLVEDQPGGLGVIALPHLDAGPFLSYGIQWIAFGVVAYLLDDGDMKAVLAWGRRAIKLRS